MLRTSPGTSSRLVQGDVTFESYDQITSQTLEPFQLIERWQVVVGAAPDVSIATPANGSSFAGQNTVPITADTTDADGWIARVNFYANNQQR